MPRTALAIIKPEAGKIAALSVSGPLTLPEADFHGHNEKSSAIIFLSIRQLERVAEHFFKKSIRGSVPLIDDKFKLFVLLNNQFLSDGLVVE